MTFSFDSWFRGLSPRLSYPFRRQGRLLLLACMLPLLWQGVAIAQGSLGEIPPAVQVTLDTLWVVFAAMLVFFMNAGFAMLESGFCRAKNTVNILAKNLIVFALSSLAFWAIGFALMFGDGNAVLGWNGFFLTGADNSPLTGSAYSGIFSSLSWAGIPLYTKFFFQLAFAGTAATIVSGAVAERIKFASFVIFSLFLVGFSYGITGHWVWGGGWLATLGFYDFAGSTVVHSVGGWAALMGVILLGPRLEKFAGDRINAIPGHNMSTATLGGLILWLGWFGFNPGSTMAADPDAISHIIVTTNMAAAAGAIAATITSWIQFGKPDLSMIINGVLAGLVGITAACAYVNVPSAIVIGAIAGVIVVFSVLTFEGLRFDDPVGALSVHLVCGIWGTLAVGLFSVGGDIYPWYAADAGPSAGLLFGGGVAQLLSQFIGVVVVGMFTAGFSFAIWLVLELSMGLRVSKEEELEGLDIGEHGMEAYHRFFRE
ncbi:MULTISPECIES: ammonium transporter [unclassified Picosynechococcus]|nr:MULTISPECIES: ammonium transporter [unclassified Picosynechococcus]AAF21444.1 ammonium transporter [Picosynechococcus sp. PCC 7002]ACB00728.1 ammonium transporter [Picosynechococcus sp. PCC 7002]SMH51568.1 ammonium transporter [Picosynechococcus sp. OG1]